MNNKNPQENLAFMGDKTILKCLLLIFLVSIFISALVIVFYFSNFNYELSKDQGTWAQFGDYIGGILNPFLNFLVLIALLITIALQSNQLELSRTELRESRLSQNVLQAAQTRQAKILEISARITTITTLIEQKEKIQETMKHIPIRTQTEFNNRELIEAQKRNLREALDQLYTDLTEMP